MDKAVNSVAEFDLILSRHDLGEYSLISFLRFVQSYDYSYSDDWVYGVTMEALDSGDFEEKGSLRPYIDEVVSKILKGYNASKDKKIELFNKISESNLSEFILPALRSIILDLLINSYITDAIYLVVKNNKSVTPFNINNMSIILQAIHTTGINKSTADDIMKIPGIADYFNVGIFVYILYISQGILSLRSIIESQDTTQIYKGLTNTLPMNDTIELANMIRYKDINIGTIMNRVLKRDDIPTDKDVDKFIEFINSYNKFYHINSHILGVFNFEQVVKIIESTDGRIPLRFILSVEDERSVDYFASNRAASDTAPNYIEAGRFFTEEEILKIPEAFDPEDVKERKDLYISRETFKVINRVHNKRQRYNEDLNSFYKIVTSSYNKRRLDMRSIIYLIDKCKPTNRVILDVIRKGDIAKLQNLYKLLND